MNGLFQQLVANRFATWSMDRLLSVVVESSDSAIAERFVTDLVERTIGDQSPSQEKQVEVEQKTKSFLDNLIGSAARIPEAIERGYADAVVMGIEAKVRAAWEFRNTDLDNFDNTRGNAIEHCYWGALMARSVSPNYAKEVAEWWESDETDPEHREQDLGNTLAGVSIGIISVDPWAMCEAAADNGTLQFNSDSTDDQSTSTDDQSTDEPSDHHDDSEHNGGVFTGDINIDPDVPDTA